MRNRTQVRKGKGGREGKGEGGKVGSGSEIGGEGGEGVGIRNVVNFSEYSNVTSDHTSSSCAHLVLILCSSCAQGS